MSLDTPTDRRGPRLKGELKYVRKVRNGFQARPYCDITHQRYTLAGIFPTAESAAAAANLFLLKGDSPTYAGPKPVDKYVRPVRRKTGVTYMALVPMRLGEFDDPALARAAVAEFIKAVYGPVVSRRVLSRFEASKNGAKMPDDGPSE